MIETGLFAFFSTITVTFALIVVFSKKIFRAAFALFGTLGGVAALLALMGATTIAALQVLIYIGGVFVLFLFAILVTERPELNLFRKSAAGAATGAGLAFVLAVILVRVAATGAMTITGHDAVSASALGRAFIGDNLLTFEAVSVLLLVGLAAAVMVIRKELRS